MQATVADLQRQLEEQVARGPPCAARLPATMHVDPTIDTTPRPECAHCKERDVVSVARPWQWCLRSHDSGADWVQLLMTLALHSIDLRFVAAVVEVRALQAGVVLLQVRMAGWSLHLCVRSQQTAAGAAKQLPSLPNPQGVPSTALEQGRAQGRVQGT